MQSQGNFPWYFPAGRLWNNIPLIISTMYYAALISRWDLSLHIWTWQRSALISLYMSLCAPDKLASFLSSFPSLPHHTLPLSLARSLAHWLKLIIISGWSFETWKDLILFLDFISDQSHQAITVLKMPYLLLPDNGGHGNRDLHNLFSAP